MAFIYVVLCVIYNFNVCFYGSHRAQVERLNVARLQFSLQSPPPWTRIIWPVPYIAYRIHTVPFLVLVYGKGQGG